MIIIFTWVKCFDSLQYFRHILTEASSEVGHAY